MASSIPGKETISHNSKRRVTKLRSNKRQIEFIRKYMDTNKEFAARVNKTNLVDVHRQWLQLRDALNKLGPVRSLEQWKICWRDQKRLRETRALQASMEATLEASIEPTPTDFGYEIIQELSDDDAPGVSVFKDELDEPEVVVWAPEKSAPNSPASPQHQNSNPPTPLNDSENEASNDEEHEALNDEEHEPSNNEEHELSNDVEYLLSNDEEDQPSPTQTDPLVSPPNEPAPRRERVKRPMLRRKNHVDSLPHQLLNTQIELNGLIKGLVKEVRRSNILREEQIRILKKQNRRSRSTGLFHL